MGLVLPHGANRVDEGVITQLKEGKVFSSKVGNLITELLMKSRYKSDLITIQIMGDLEGSIEVVILGREVWEVYSVA